LVEHDGRLHPGDVLPREHTALREGDDRLVRAARRAVDEHDESASLDGVARAVGEDDLLRGLVQYDEDRACAGTEGLLLAHDLASPVDLTRAQRVERVKGRGLDGAG